MNRRKRKSFVTLFDSYYLSRGLAMYESMLHHMEDFILYIIAFDDKAYKKLRESNLKKAVIIPLCEFEDEELLKVKKDRTRAEYCWTCSSKSLLYILEKYHEEECTYVDADVYFFDNPTCLIEELGENNSVLITEHRYSDYCNLEKTSGKYNVQFVTIKNDEYGMKALRWWTDRCIEWCFYRIEDGRLGDQKYLDEFCERFERVHELQHLGGGVAPWNVSQYTFMREGEKIFLKRKNVEEKIPLVFYHFHSLQFYDKDVVHLAGSSYKIPDTAIAYIYKEYIRETERVCKKYSLYDEKSCWMREEKFRDDDMDMLKHESNYYNYGLFV